MGMLLAGMARSRRFDVNVGMDAEVEGDDAIRERRNGPSTRRVAFDENHGDVLNPEEKTERRGRSWSWWVGTSNDDNDVPRLKSRVPRGPSCPRALDQRRRRRRRHLAMNDLLQLPRSYCMARTCTRTSTMYAETGHATTSGLPATLSSS